MYRYAHLIPHFTSWNLNNRSVVLRADLNTTIKPHTDNFKIEAALPTIEYLLHHKALVHVFTHIGSPHGYQATLTTKSLADWFIRKGYPVGTQLVIEENTRFHHEELTQDLSWARKMAHNSDFYINDAFGTLHRTDTSLTTLARLFPPERKSIGFLVHKELSHLYALLAQQKPLTLIVGGGKYDKLKILAAALPYIDRLLLCPGLSCALLFPQQYPQELQASIKALQHAAASGKVLVPQDYFTSRTQDWKRPYQILPTQALTVHDIPISIGPATLATWRLYIQTAQLIIFNGPMGSLDIPDTLPFTKALLDFICQSPAYRVVGGDSSSEMIEALHLSSQIDYLSTGGGALLSVIADLPLPGLEALLALKNEGL